jgi:hypothetical protein
MRHRGDLVALAFDGGVWMFRCLRCRLEHEASSPLAAGRGLATGGLLAALLLASTPAAAEPVIAGDLDYTVPLDEDDATSGGGFGIRLGQQLEGAGAALTPELGFTYANFGGDFPAKVYRGLGGFRFGVGELVRPGLFGHVGMGRIEVDVPNGTPDPTHSAFTFDIGLFVDFVPIQHLNLGVHGSYNRVAAGDSGTAFRWATAGAHAGIVF